MDDLWGSIEAAQWREVPFVSARVATEADVASGAAVFYIQGDAEPASIALPFCALQKLENGSIQQVIAIQAEKTRHGVYLGVRPLVGGNCICSLEEVELVPAGFSL